MTKVRRRFGTEMLPGFTEELWLRDIRPSKSPLREEAGPVDGLALSIEEKGLLQPLVVRPLKEGFEVVAGNRRLGACRLLGMKKVPCYVVGLDSKQAYEVSIIENLQRNSLNPIEEARAFRRYVDEYGYGGVSELARRIGKSEPYVSKRLGLLDLPKTVQEDIIRRRIAPSVAEELSNLDASEATRLVDRFARGIRRSEDSRTVKEQKKEEAAIGIHGYTMEEAEVRKIDRAMSKSIASLKVCLTQIDDIVDNLNEDEWFVRREALIHCRWTIHQFIDNIITLQKRGDSYSRLLAPHFSGTGGHDADSAKGQQKLPLPRNRNPR